MKLAFPNYDEYQATRPLYNLNRWMDAMKNIYVKTHLGASKNEAIDTITHDWSITERTDFSNWLKYYESGDQYKYKKAQKASYYVNDDLNYFLPNPKAVVPSPIKTINEQIAAAPQQAVDEVAKKQNEDEKRRVIEDARRKILGRLNSAEKLLSSQQGQMFAGSDFERLLTAIFELKKQIQTVNKFASIQTIVDLTIRQANILLKEGYNEPAQFMVKLAQTTPGDFSVNLGEIPSGGSVPLGGGSLSNNVPNLETAPPASDKITEESAIGKFIDNLEDSGITDTPDEEKNEDKAMAEDGNEIDMGDDIILEQEIAPEKDELVVEAQAVSPPAAPAAPKPKDDLEVEAPKKDVPEGLTPEDVKRAPVAEPKKNNIDAILDSALNNITIEDVIQKMEEINSIFRTREVPRQIAICDFMLSRLGIAQFVPELSEVLNKNLDSSQYSLIRMESILSRLRGSVKTKDIDLTGKDQRTPPGAEAIKSNLEQMEAKEKQRKEVKKQLADQSDLERATKPEGTVEAPQAELAAAPAEVEAPAAPAPAPRPTAPAV
jgi:hypothetical protein